MANLPGLSPNSLSNSGTIFNVQTDSIDHAQSVGGAVYHPHEITYCPQHQHFQMSLRARQLAGLTLGFLEYRSTTHLVSEPAPDSYQINFTAFGSVTMAQSNTTVTASPEYAAIHDWTDKPALQGWQHPARVVGLKIPRQRVHDELTALIGAELTQELRCDPGVKLTSPAGQEWKNLVAHLARSLNAPTPLLDHSMISTPLTQAVVRGFLLLTRHNFSHLLHGEVAPTGPSYLDEALEYMHEHSHLPITVNDVAAAVNVSVRSLQAGFRKYRQRTPAQALRDIRLHRARRDLLTAVPTDTVTDVAARWGFHHPGRFAVHYAQTFDESPSETLARRRTNRRGPESGTA